MPRIPSDLLVEILRCTDTADLLRWCSEDRVVGGLAACDRVWSERTVVPADDHSIQMAVQFRHLVRHLDLGQLDPSQLRSIWGFDRLESLSFQGMRNLTDELVIAVLRENHSSTIRSINIAACTELSNKTLSAISQMCPSLETIDISGDFFTCSGLARLSECRGLRRIAMSSCFLLTAEDLCRLLPTLPRLRALDVSHNAQVDYPTLGRLLADMPSLRVLCVRGCEDLTVHRIELLRRKAPRVRIEHDARLYDDSVESIRAYIMSIIGVH